jgi:hypothetical protein
MRVGEAQHRDGESRALAESAPRFVVPSDALSCFSDPGFIRSWVRNDLSAKLHKCALLDAKIEEGGWEPWR